MSFLPDGYIPPATGGGYIKLQDGENRLRVLTKPILGWEEWVDNHPKRYRYSDKPTTPFDPERPPRHFWAMVVWHCQEKRIGIWHVTQATIQKAIRELSCDPEWGSPINYDLKITRSGEGLKTEYRVTPLVPKQLTDEQIDAFRAAPITLDALFRGDDPFSDDSNVVGLAIEANGLITRDQALQLEDLSAGQEGYASKILQHFGIQDWTQLPSDKFEGVYKKMRENIDKNEVPF